MADIPPPDQEPLGDPPPPSVDSVDARREVESESGPPPEPHAAPAPSSVDEVILHALAAATAPLSGAEIARGVAATGAFDLRGREGSLYAVLFALRRDGKIAGGWRNHSAGRRFVYAAPGRLPPDGMDAAEAGAGVPTNARPAPDAFLRAAERSVSRLSFAPRLMEELRVELLHHMKDNLDPPNVTAGAEISAAARESAVVSALGDPWKTSVDLVRVARGRAIAPFPRTAADALRSAWIYDAPVLLGIILTILFIRVEVVTAYHIPTKSMEPTLHGSPVDGDRILVLKCAPAPDLFDIYVFDGWRDDRKHFVKRCLGLPGQNVRFREGDVYIDGQLVRKDGDRLDSLLFPLWDADDLLRVAAAESDPDAAHAVPRDRSIPRNFSQDMEDLWSRKDGARWLLEADGTFDVFAGERPAVLRYDRDPTDGIYDAATASVRDSGLVSVSDLRVTFDVTPRDDVARVRLRLGRGEQLCEAVLIGEGPGVALTVDGKVVARNAQVSLRVGVTTRVRFSRVDYVLRLDVAGKEVLRFELPAPEKPKRDGPAAFIEAQLDTGSARIRPVRIERDVHWTSDHGEEADVTLGEDEFFMAGDNSSNSSDSRAHGPVRRERLVGRPMLIVWPFSRFRIPR